MKSRLKYHTHLLPAMKGLVEELEVGRDGSDDASCPLWVDLWNECGSDIGVFDCCALDEGFLRESGEAALEEWAATDELPELPMPWMYMEFASFGAFCCSGNHFLNKLALTEEVVDNLETGGDYGPSKTTYEIWPTMFGPVERFFYMEKGTHISAEPFSVQRMTDETARWPDDFTGSVFSNVNTWPDGEDGWLTSLHPIIAGVVSLFEASLASTRTAHARTRYADSGVKRSSSRQAPYYVTTLNLAEAARQVARNTGGGHASPRLHWRRGHYRVLNRLSEFERRTWVRRCLVGDGEPEQQKGRSHYRVKFAPRVVAS